jgi:hypothetical protein
MAKRFLVHGMVAIMLVFGIMVVGCDDDDKAEEVDAPYFSGVSADTVGKRYTARWDPVQNARRYYLQWSTNSSFNTINGDVTTSGTSYHFSLSDFNEVRLHNQSTNYYFRIRAVGSSSTSPWTSRASPTLINPSVF